MDISYLDIEKEVDEICINEGSYNVEMDNFVEPYLKNIREDGFIDSLYYEIYPHNNSKGTIVICYGFTESCLKYHELIYYFHKQGYMVAAIEHRGHGKSIREVENKSIVHIDDFTKYVDDLHNFITKLVLNRSNVKPMFLYAHSMGGCIGALYLEKHPKVFTKAILNAPMLSIKAGGLPHPIINAICGFQIMLGRGKNKIFVQSEFNRNERFKDSAGKSEARYNYYHKRRLDDEAYQTYCASYYWIREAVRAGRKLLKPENLNKVEAEILLIQAEYDTYVKPQSHTRFIKGISNGRILIVKDEKHEIMRGSNKVLNAYLNMVFEFYK